MSNESFQSAYKDFLAKTNSRCSWITFDISKGFTLTRTIFPVSIILPHLVTAVPEQKLYPQCDSCVWDGNLCWDLSLENLPSCGYVPWQESPFPHQTAYTKHCPRFAKLQFQSHLTLRIIGQLGNLCLKIRTREAVKPVTNFSSYSSILTRPKFQLSEHYSARGLLVSSIQQKPPMHRRLDQLFIRAHLMSKRHTFYTA